MDLIAWTPNLTFLDISYAKKLTDDGMHHFKEKVIPIKKLFVNGLTSVSSAGISTLIHACTPTLRILEAALNDQETLNGQVCHAI